MKELLHILLLEDNPADAELNEHMLRRAGLEFTSQRVDTRDAFVAALDAFHPDLVLADYNLPGFDGVQALAIVREHSPDLPYIFVTGAMGEGPAVEAVRRGATDYILKDRLARLPMAVQRALDEKKTRQKRHEAEADLVKNHAQLQQLLLAANQSRRALLSVVEDLKQTETELQHANRAFATLSAVNRSLVHASSEDELLQAICQAIVKQRGYRMAWVGYVQHDEEKSIRIMARSNMETHDPNQMLLSWDKSECGMGPSGLAIHSGCTQVCQDINNDPHYQLWREAARQCGCAANIALPLADERSGVFGVLNVCADEANAFSSAEVSLLEEMAGDLAFGVRTLHIRSERDAALQQNQQQILQLQQNLEDTVRAIATMVEMRDPYTAGHQARVADLASALARKIGLPEAQVHGIHLAGMVHDLGKIRIPAEILSNPGRLNEIEFSLIKMHPRAGYDILKGINFPWPIAQIVLQHHERLDGSGYPQGLKGDEILPEARILSIADIVEAMSSHRPYRPGLGIEAALNEITHGRGTHYDPQVVDACLSLFNDGGYAF